MRLINIIITLILTALFAACTSDSIIDNSGNQQATQDAVVFNMKVGNSTRTSTPAYIADHYEFGVFAGFGETQAESDKMMFNDYLVAYGENPLYSTIHNTQTYGNQNPNGSITDERTGRSSWFYQGLSTSDGTHTAYNIPDYSQVLKYWDKSKATTYFYAYAPYTHTTENYSAHNPLKVTYASDALTFNSLSIFYTSPEDGSQISTANTAAADATKTSPLYTGSTYDKEMVNYNEAIYAYAPISKAAYGSDVPLNFQHLNAKIMIKFYTDLSDPVVITDLVPNAIAQGTQEPPAVKNPAFSIPAAKGIQFTPATSAQTEYKKGDTYKQQTVEGSLPKYDQQTTLKVSGFHYVTRVNRTQVYQVNTNFIFKAPTGQLPTVKTDALPSPTTLYYLPFNEAGERGFTMHLSYTVNGTQYYDARLFITDDQATWEAGKAYTYIFKITEGGNGVTDPGNVRDEYYPEGGSTQQPWVDPRDPRIKDAQYLPIILDGVVVDDSYDNGGGITLE